MVVLHLLLYRSEVQHLVPFPKYETQLIISVGGVVQEPDSTGTTGFQLSGTNIVFSSAPASGESFFGVLLASADYLNAGGTFPDGTVAVPSITFTEDTDTGFLRVSSGQFLLLLMEPKLHSSQQAQVLQMDSYYPQMELVYFHMLMHHLELLEVDLTRFVYGEWNNNNN